MMLVIIGFGVVLFSFGLALFYWSYTTTKTDDPKKEKKDRRKTISRESGKILLSTGLIIIGVQFIIGLIQQKEREEFFKQTSAQMLRNILVSKMPEELVDTLQDFLFDKPFVYRDFQSTVVLKQDIENKDCLVGTVNNTMVVENRSGYEVIFPIQTFVKDRAIGCDKVILESVKVKKLGTVEEEEFDKKKISSHENDLKGLVFEIQLSDTNAKIIKVLPKEKIHIERLFSIQTKRNDRFELTPIRACVNMSLQVSLPDDVIIQHIIFEHPFIEREDYNKYLYNTKTGKSFAQADIKGGILPYHSIAMEWVEKKSLFDVSNAVQENTGSNNKTTP